MNRVGNLVKRACDMRKTGAFLLLLACAFVFALPFITKGFAGEYVKTSAVFGWIGLSLPFAVIFDCKKTLKRVLCSLFCFFFAFYFFVYSWFINLYPLDFAGLGNLESIGVIIIAETVIPFLHSAIMTVCVFISFLAARQMKSALFKAVLLSFGYVLGEFMQSVGTLAFPWARLFVGQTEFVYLLQSASLFGSYFITFIMVLVNTLFAFSLVSLTESRRKSRIYAAVAVGIFLLNLTYGVLRINLTDLSDSKKIDAVVLQGNIPSSQKWSGEIDEKKIYLELAESFDAGGFDADIAVMPETAFPVALCPFDGYDSPSENALMLISKKLDATLFAGAFYKENGNSYNSIFAYDKDGCIAAPYNKYNIVPFGEYLPYRSIIEALVPSLAEINMLSSDLSRGDTFEPIETEAGSAACLVCFDSIFPETARRQVKKGADFIVISTNDSWYKTSGALYQHADHAILRAIENNAPVIRSANTGISRIIDSFGRVVNETCVNERTLMNGSVLVPEKGTLYTLIGDAFVMLSLACVVFTLILGFARKKAFRS